MVILSIRTQLTVDDFVEAAEQLSTAELEKLARRLLQTFLSARRNSSKALHKQAHLAHYQNCCF